MLCFANLSSTSSKPKFVLKCSVAACDSTVLYMLMHATSFGYLLHAIQPVDCRLRCAGVGRQQADAGMGASANSLMEITSCSL